jgi:hypothetical protein
MKSAFVYYLEFTNDKNIYIKLLTESIRRLIEYKYCEGRDIFVNVIGYSGSPMWQAGRYVAISEDANSTFKQLEKLVTTYNINLIDVSEDRLHYVELPIIVDIPLPRANDIQTFTSTETSRLKLFNHKFTSYPQIIQRGYDRIIQIDADLCFFKENKELFNIPLSVDPDQIYFCRFNDTMFDTQLSSNSTVINIKNRIKEREHNMSKLFSLDNSIESKNSYLLAKNFINGSINYNLDNFVDDIYNQNFWIAGWAGIFDKPFIEKHFRLLAFLNYFFTKDDEIALMLYCFANNIKVRDLDPECLISCGRGSYNKNKHIAYHPAGDSTIKTDFINNNWMPV